MNILNVFLNPAAAFWTMVTAIIAFVASWIALVQLKHLTKTSKGDFLHKLKTDVFTKDSEELTYFIEYDLLDFVELDGNTAVFKTKKDKHKLVNNPAKVYTTTEVDRLLLGHFEDIGILEGKGLIDIDSVYEEFSEYLERTWENEAVKKYIKKTVGGDYNDTYSKFDYIYQKCVSYGKAKRGKQKMFLWNTRWWIKENILKV